MLLFDVVVQLHQFFGARQISVVVVIRLGSLGVIRARGHECEGRGRVLHRRLRYVYVWSWEVVYGKETTYTCPQSNQVSEDVCEVHWLVGLCHLGRSLRIRIKV